MSSFHDIKNFLRNKKRKEKNNNSSTYFHKTHYPLETTLSSQIE